MTKTFNRNPNGINQWQQRSNQEIQEIINKFPHFTKKNEGPFLSVFASFCAAGQAAERWKWL